MSGLGKRNVGGTPGGRRDETGRAAEATGARKGPKNSTPQANVERPAAEQGMSPAADASAAAANASAAAANASAAADSEGLAPPSRARRLNFGGSLRTAASALEAAAAAGGGAANEVIPTLVDGGAAGGSGGGPANEGIPTLDDDGSDLDTRPAIITPAEIDVLLGQAGLLYDIARNHKPDRNKNEMSKMKTLRCGRLSGGKGLDYAIETLFDADKGQLRHRLDEATPKDWEKYGTALLLLVNVAGKVQCKTDKEQAFIEHILLSPECNSDYFLGLCFGGVAPWDHVATVGHPDNRLRPLVKDIRDWRAFANLGQQVQLALTRYCERCRHRGASGWQEKTLKLNNIALYNGMVEGPFNRDGQLTAHVSDVVLRAWEPWFDELAVKQGGGRRIITFANARIAIRARCRHSHDPKDIPEMIGLGIDEADVPDGLLDVVIRGLAGDGGTEQLNACLEFMRESTGALQDYLRQLPASGKPLPSTCEVLTKEQFQAAWAGVGLLHARAAIWLDTARNRDPEGMLRSFLKGVPLPIKLDSKQARADGTKMLCMQFVSAAGVALLMLSAAFGGMSGSDMYTLLHRTVRPRRVEGVQQSHMLAIDLDHCNLTGWIQLFMSSKDNRDHLGLDEFCQAYLGLALRGRNCLLCFGKSGEPWSFDPRDCVEIIDESASHSFEARREQFRRDLGGRGPYAAANALLGEALRQAGAGGRRDSCIFGFVERRIEKFARGDDAFFERFRFDEDFADRFLPFVEALLEFQLALGKCRPEHPYAVKKPAGVEITVHNYGEYLDLHHDHRTGQPLCFCYRYKKGDLGKASNVAFGGPAHMDAFLDIAKHMKTKGFPFIWLRSKEFMQLKETAKSASWVDNASVALLAD